MNPVEQKLDIQKEIESKSNKVIPEDVTQSILRELNIFESNELFLKKGITLNNLAKQIKTNSSYLSDTINTYKEKNFATYLNDLRIDYALDRLVKDKKFRAYKLAVIADELGYNNEQAFASAFKRKTGTTLSIYIKEIEKTGTL
ncbi:AraC family transcriptional regulator [Elizabethkingia sp. M8]|uniref:helix-turn-helix domain-containing protein n=1 Tax=Elizabethkingia sp. M8 TaxID=2796140 RepID=UPI001907EE8A|nr:helix-turn-helix domain-containing protein [Elizabethkingia sp. M8]